MGKLLVLEGLDGTGKTTQTELLAAALRAEDRKVRTISFPAYDSESSALVRMYLEGRMGEDPDGVNAYAASVFYAADRYITYLTDWKRDFDDPDTLLLATRYTTANAYHQLSKLPRGEWESFLSWLCDLEFGRMGLPRPDVVLLLELSPELAARQVQRRCAESGVSRDIHEKDEGYLLRCRDAAVFAAERLGWRRIACAENGTVLPREEITRRLRAALPL